MLLDEIRAKKTELESLAAEYGASNLRIFGSVARGEETPDSDIDMVADFAAGRSYADLWTLQDQLAEFLGRSVDLSSTPATQRIAEFIESDIKRL